MLVDKYHLPHNSVRIDEFNFMLESIEKTKEFYLYNDLRVLFLYEEIKQNMFSIFHKTLDKNLKNHENENIRMIYNTLISNPTIEKTKAILDNQYTFKKTFKQVWNESVRDYTELFAFLGLLPTYYKGSSGDTDKKHYTTSRLKDYCKGVITLRDIMLNLKYRNSSKNSDSFEMYNIKVRPFVIAIKAMQYFINKGFNYIDPHILSAIIIYSKDESSYEILCECFKDPMLEITNYKDLFFVPENGSDDYIDRAIKEIRRSTLFLKPYLKALNLVAVKKYNKYDKYIPLMKNFQTSEIPQKCVFCNDLIGNLKLTPLIGKVLNTCLKNSLVEEKGYLNINKLFDSHFTVQDINTVIHELIEVGVLVEKNGNEVVIADRKNQFAINPFSDFFTIEDANYVANVKDIFIENDSKIIITESTVFDNKLKDLKEIAYGSNGSLYEEALFSIIDKNFNVFKNRKWYGSMARGKRISDIAFTADIFDNNASKKILIIIECKAGEALKAFDERKEIDNIQNLLKTFPNKNIDGIWYWVVNGNSIPDYDKHGGYRVQDYSKNLFQKLNDIQFNINEFSRMPTIVTVFSYNAICEYLRYIYLKTKNQDRITPLIVPHFWRWSKKFMNLQYVMIHKELNIGV